MPKLKKCLYLIDLLSRRGPMSLKEIDEYNQYWPIYDGEIISRTFARYKGRRDRYPGPLFRFDEPVPYDYHSANS